MASGKEVARKAKLAAALKQNLKRRRAATPGGSKAKADSGQDVGLGAGIAPQTGLKPLSGKSPKTASKRN